MSRAAMMALAAVAALGCGARPWNYDETSRISDVMREAEEPVAVAHQRSVVSPGMPELAAYTPPVFVRDTRDRHRRPPLKGKRASAAAAEQVQELLRPKPGAARARKRLPARTNPN